MWICSKDLKPHPSPCTWISHYRVATLQSRQNSPCFPCALNYFPVFFFWHQNNFYSTTTKERYVTNNQLYYTHNNFILFSQLTNTKFTTTVKTSWKYLTTTLVYCLIFKFPVQEINSLSKYEFLVFFNKFQMNMQIPGFPCFPCAVASLH